MASFAGKLSSANITWNDGINTMNAPRNDLLLEQHWVPDKTRGTKLTFPNGTFLTATDLMKFRRWIELGAIQDTVSSTSGRPSWVKSTPGGWRPDIVLTSNSGNLKSSIGSLASISGTPVIPSSMRSEAATKALLKIADEKAGIASDLATFRQTVELLHNPCKELYNLLKNFHDDKLMRRFRNTPYRALRDAQTISKDVARRYLEYVYGWKPLMADIYGTYGILKKHANDAFLLSGSGSSQQQCQCPSITCNDISYNSVTVHGPYDEKAHVRCKIWARIDPNCPGLRTINQVGLLNPLSLIWDLTPWSFVVDWFVPIGSVLQALTAPAGLNFVDGSMSVKNSFTGPYVHHHRIYDANAKINNFGTGTVRYEGYKRERLTSWPLPGVWASQHPFVGDRPWKALALLVQSLPNLRR